MSHSNSIDDGIEAWILRCSLTIISIFGPCYQNQAVWYALARLGMRSQAELIERTFLAFKVMNFKLSQVAKVERENMGKTGEMGCGQEFETSRLEKIESGIPSESFHVIYDSL